MTAKEKAKDLFEKYYKLVDKSRLNKHDNQPELNAKQCALIACEEIINSKPIGNSLEYWQEVKQELLNLK
jgi:hypothetical protein